MLLRRVNSNTVKSSQLPEICVQAGVETTSHLLTDQRFQELNLPMTQVTSLSLAFLRCYNMKMNNYMFVGGSRRIKSTCFHRMLVGFRVSEE